MLRPKGLACAACRPSQVKVADEVTEVFGWMWLARVLSVFLQINARVLLLFLLLIQ